MSGARYYRVLAGTGPSWAVEEGEQQRLLDGAPWDAPRALAETVPLASARLLAPAAPSKIVAVGRNYADHAKERGKPVPKEPLLFLKPPSALLEPDGVIELPDRQLASQIEHEVELGLVIGQRTRRADPQAAAKAIFGYTVVGDITARDLQQRDKQWTRAKGMDTFCPVGPVVVSGLDASALDIRCSVNGAVRQQRTTADTVFSPAFIVAYASQVMTLEPGDLIATGTPAGVGPLGDDKVLRLIANAHHPQSCCLLNLREHK